MPYLKKTKKKNPGVNTIENSKLTNSHVNQISNNFNVNITGLANNSKDSEHFGLMVKHFLSLSSSYIELDTNVKQEVLSKYFQYIMFESGEVQVSGLTEEHASNQEKLLITDIFVPLQFKEYKEISNLEVNNWLNKLHENGLLLEDILGSKEPLRLSILSGPGGGKTTLLKWIVSNYSFSPDTEMFGFHPNREWFPICITCRDIDFSNKPTMKRIISDIPVRAEIDINDNYPNLFFDLVRLYLENGTALLLVDGVDEINDEVQRMDFINQVRKFLNEYPSLNVIITSRIAGYSNIVFDNLSDFSKFEILPFSDENIENYCITWFKHINKDDGESKSNAVQISNEIISNVRLRALAGNPLLLTTLLIVGGKEGKFPVNRVSLYERTVQVLLERWNRKSSEEIDVDSAKYQLACIAYEMTSNQKQTITKSELIELLRSVREDARGRVDTNDSYTSFINKVERRSGLFVKKGITSANSGKKEAIYEFQHLVFQEYLMAIAIMERCNPSAKQKVTLCSLLGELISKEYMRETVLLVLALCNESETEPIIDFIINSCIATDLTLSASNYLHTLLLQIIADEGLIYFKVRKRMYEFYFKYGIFGDEVEIIKMIMQGNYASEFSKAAHNYEEKEYDSVPLYSSLFKVLGEKKMDIYDYYVALKNKKGDEELVSGLAFVDSYIWVYGESAFGEFDPSKIEKMIYEIFSYATDSILKVRRIAMSLLRTLLFFASRNSRFDNHYKYCCTYIKFINDFQKIPKISGKAVVFSDFAGDDLPALTEDASNGLKMKIFDFNVCFSNDYRDLLAMLAILLFCGYHKNVDEILKDFAERRISVLQRVDESWMPFKHIDDVFCEMLRSLKNTIKWSNYGSLGCVDEYINSVNDYWNAHNEGVRNKIGIITPEMEDFMEELDEKLIELEENKGHEHANYNRNTKQTGLDIGKRVTLDNDYEFIVSGRTIYKERIYYMFSNAENFYDMRIGYLTIEKDAIKVNFVDKDSGVNIPEIIELLSISAREYLGNLDLSDFEGWNANNQEVSNEIEIMTPIAEEKSVGVEDETICENSVYDDNMGKLGLDIGKLITLDNDQEFIVSGRATYKERTYYMFSNAENFYNMRIGYLTIEKDAIKVNIVDKDSGVNIPEIIELLSISAREYLGNLDLSDY